MKITHFIPSINKTSGGTATYLKLIAEELNCNELEITVATGIPNNPIELLGIKTTFFNTNLKRWFRLKKEFNRYLVLEKPDLVHINGIWNPENALFQKSAKDLGIKVVLSPHGMLEPYILNRNPLKKKIALMLYQNKALKTADYFHATAIEEKNNISSLGFNKPIHIIANGIDLNEIRKVKTYYGTKKIVFFSRIHPKKGIELLIDAWRTISKTEWTLEIAGNGDQDYIETLKQRASDIKNIIFVGPQFGEAKWDFLRSADVMVLPTYSENFGIVVLESLAVGVPVITTKGTPWEELKTHNSGWWIDLSVSNLEQTLIDVMNSDREELESKGKNGRKLVLEKYDIQLIGSETKEMYNLLINQK